MIAEAVEAAGAVMIIKRPQMLPDSVVGCFWRRFTDEAPQDVIYDALVSTKESTTERLSMMMPPCVRSLFTDKVSARIAMLEDPKRSPRMCFTFSELPSPDWPTFELMYRKGKEVRNHRYNIFNMGMTQLVEEHHHPALLSDRYFEARVRLFVYFMFGYVLQPNRVSTCGNGAGTIQVRVSFNPAGPHVTIFEGRHDR